MEINISTDTVIDSGKLLGKEVTFVENENENVFHYTSLAGFEGILRSGKLRFTRVDCMNDETEDRITHNIFYTAITRARNFLTIYWSPEVCDRILARIRPANSNKDYLLLKSKRSIE